jgi:hypothetical protein
MHKEARNFIAAIVARTGPGTSVWEIGGRAVNGEVRDLFRGANYLSIDLLAGPGVDVVADGATFAPGRMVDRVVCAEVLEHAPNAEAIVVNAWARLAPLGWLIITCAGPERKPHSGVDGGALRPDEWYRNINPAYLAGWIKGAALADGSPVAALHVQHASDRGDVYAFAQKGCRQ